MLKFVRGVTSFIAFLLAAGAAHAGPFDCSVVYDEFDSFMNRNYLLNPEAYGQVLQGQITRDQYNGAQKGRIMLRPGRQGWGVAIVQTNKNLRGKFVYTWGGRGDSRGTPLLILRDVTLYARVEDGTGRKLTREIRVTASQTVDLDKGRASIGANADIRFRNVDGKTLALEAVNGAKLTFPMESLCKQG